MVDASSTPGRVEPTIEPDSRSRKGKELGLDVPVEELLALDEALDRLDAIDPRLRQVIEYRFFAGMTEQEIAEVRRLSTAHTLRERIGVPLPLGARVDHRRLMDGLRTAVGEGFDREWREGQMCSYARWIESTDDTEAP